jgi:hypothetical protein
MMAPPAEAQQPCTGVIRVIFDPTVCTIRQPDSGLTCDDDPERHVKLAAEQALREQQHRNDAHGLLRIVAAMAERNEGCCRKLKPLEDWLDRSRIGTHEHPRNRED